MRRRLVAALSLAALLGLGLGLAATGGAVMVLTSVEMVAGPTP